MNPLSPQSAELELCNVVATVARTPVEGTETVAPEDGTDHRRSLVPQYTVGVAEALGLADAEADADADAEDVETVDPVAAEAEGPDAKTIPRPSAVNSAVRVRTPLPNPN